MAFQSKEERCFPFVSGLPLPEKRVRWRSAGSFPEQPLVIEPNISVDILNSVFYRFSGTIYDVITSLICILQKREYL